MDGLDFNLNEKLSYKQIIGGAVAGFIISLVYSYGQQKLIETDSNTVTMLGNNAANPSIQVEVSGAITVPGVYTLDEGSRIGELIALGKGITNEASADWVTRNLNGAQILNDSQKVYIPFEWELPHEKEYVVSALDVKAPEKSLQEVSKNTSELTNSDNTANTDKINVNTATTEALKELPGIGDVYSQKIVDNRPYADLEDLLSRSGISNATYEKIKDLISL